MKAATFALALAALAVPLAAGAQDLRPGQYRTTTTVDVPELTGKPMVEEDCITQKEIDEGLSKFGIEKDSGCKVSNLKRSPGKVSYRSECNEEGMKSTSTVSGTMGGDAFDFAVATTSKLSGGKPIRARIVGKRVGTCR